MIFDKSQDMHRTILQTPCHMLRSSNARTVTSTIAKKTSDKCRAWIEMVLRVIRGVRWFTSTTITTDPLRRPIPINEDAAVFAQKNRKTLIQKTLPEGTIPPVLGNKTYKEKFVWDEQQRLKEFEMRKVCTTMCTMARASAS